MPPSKRRKTFESNNNNNNDNDDGVEAWELDEDDSSTTIKASDAKSKSDNVKLLPSKNTSEIGMLYTHGLSFKNNTTGEEKTMYMGDCKFRILTKFSPIVNFNAYFSYVINNMCGYINSNTLDLSQLKYNAEKVLTQGFLACLYYNNVVLPNKIQLMVHDGSILLGECLYYTCSYTKDELTLHISRTLTTRMILAAMKHNIIFSDEINKEQLSFKDSLMSNVTYISSDELNRVLTTLFVIADHAATHFIEDYVHNQTDWIHHFNFGKITEHFVLINSVFSIAALIHEVDLLPTITVEDKSSNVTNGSSLIERILDNTNLTLQPLEPITVLNGF